MARDDREDQDLIIDVEIPADIDMGVDFDGLPMVVAKEKPKADPKLDKAVDKPELKKPDPVKPDADIARLTRERDEATALAQRIAREADERLASERSARIRAEGASAEDRGVAMRAHWSKVTAEAQAIDTALASAKQMAATAKAQLRAAKEAGDLDGEVVAQERLAQAMQDQRELETGKRGAVEEVERVRGILRSMAEVEAAPKPEVRQEPVKKPEPKQQTPDDWIAQFPKETTGAWLSEHKDFVTDDKKHRKLMRYVEDLVDDHGQGFLHSQDFVDKLNERFFPKAKQEDDVAADKDDAGVEIDTAEPETPPAKASIPAAPVSRGAPAKASGGTQTKVRLTQEQAAIAPHLYPDAKSPQEARQAYALDLLRAQKEGRFESRS